MHFNRSSSVATRIAPLLRVAAVRRWGFNLAPGARKRGAPSQELALEAVSSSGRSMILSLLALDESRRPCLGAALLSGWFTEEPLAARDIDLSDHALARKRGRRASKGPEYDPQVRCSSLEVRSRKLEERKQAAAEALKRRLERGES